MKLRYGFLLVGVIVGLVAFCLHVGSKYLPVPETQVITCQELTKLQQDAYQAGANDALTAFACVALQSELERTNRTYAAMFDMVRNQLSITTKPKGEMDTEK